MKAVLVRKENAQIVKQRLFLEGALDKTRKILEKENCLEMPVSDSFHANDLAMITQDKPEFYFPKKTLADFIDMTEKEKRLLPSGWQILGDIIIVSLNPELKNRKAEIGEALLCLYPGCITVLLDCGIYGKMRQPAREIIAGSKTETIHRENGCLFKLDAMQLMYSRGNLFEKKRMSKFGKDETVIDMFAGIGYFSIPMAVHSKPGRIISIEINPLAFSYLKENIKLNKVEDIIEPVAGDCSEVVPCGKAHRVIMGYLDGHKYLPCGISALLPGGMLHYHEAVPEAIENRPVKRVIEDAAILRRKAEIIEKRRIKKYSPGVWHVVVDARIL